MADDLEAFLRQAAQKRSQRQKPARAEPEPARPEPPLAPRPDENRSQVVEAIVVPEGLPNPFQPRVDTSGFKRRAEHLGEEVGLADEAMETHLAQRFDHQVGTFSDGGIGSLETSDVADPIGASGPTVGSAIVEMLKNPDTVRQAILLSEILTRPEHRW